MHTQVRSDRFRLIGALLIDIVYDYIHVSTIHNSSIPSDDLLTDETQSQLLALANTHEFNLAYNASDTIRAIAGSTLAAQM